jgi:ABC-type branched-subunit amino acid transport system ATPase component
MVVIGGLGSVGGAVLGALYTIGLPAVFGDSLAIGVATSGIGLLALLLYAPGGLMQFVYKARDLMLAHVQRRMAPVQRTVHAGATVASLPTTRGHVTRDPVTDEPVPALLAEGISVSFGGTQALRNVTVRADQGEVVGLIGSNGAGKSTLMNVISGFVSPTEGLVTIAGTDATSLPPHARASLGVGRVFQDARLFGDLTLRETVKVALEAHERSEFIPSLLSLPPSRRAERTKAREADAYIDFLGLGRYADHFLSDLSTGTRRIVEMCCLLAQGSALLLLDEPTAGVAQRETEAFGPLIKRIQAELGATIVIIEHDIPLVVSISDRMYCFAAGEQIAEGPPDDVRNDPAVVAAYLGTDERAIARSGVAGAGDKVAPQSRSLVMASAANEVAP